LRILMEAIEVIRRLFSGKVVKYSGEYIKLESARLYTMPQTPPPIYVATAGPIQSERTGRYCDGIITVGAADEKIRMLMQKFEEGARQEDKDPSLMPRMIQLHISWAEDQEEAEQQAVKEWPNGGMPFPKADIRNPTWTSTWSTSSTTWIWASTRFTSTTSGATRRSSSGPTGSV
jgi:coenzyme F420-dependent glucose-6-phosphate dehydrogenase